MWLRPRERGEHASCVRGRRQQGEMWWAGLLWTGGKRGEMRQEEKGGLRPARNFPNLPEKERERKRDQKKINKEGKNSGKRGIKEGKGREGG